MSYQIVEQNYSASKAIAPYYGELLKQLDKKIAVVIAMQKEFESFPEFSPVSFEPPKEVVDLRGRKFIEYRSSIAVLRLYRDEPIGWIYGEVEQYVPWTSLRKCFAVSYVLNGAGGLQPNVVGYYSFGDEFPKASLLADRIIHSLVHGELTEEQLTARSTFVEVTQS
jgi:hypothetical protein